MAGLDEVHGILRKALRTARESDRPEPPYHADGPPLKCPALDQIRISLWCAHLLEHRAQRGERTKMKRIEEAVGAFLAKPFRMGKADPALRKLQALGEPTPGSSVPLVCLHRAASGAATYARGKPDLVHTSAAVSVSRVTGELTLDPQPMTARAFLQALDDALMRYEMAAAIRERAGATPPIARVLSRTADVAGAMTCWIGVLEDGRYALLTKLDRVKWLFVEGSRDHVLASVPDALFPTVAIRLT